jgi:predicted component of type VI protein secretion system
MPAPIYQMMMRSGVNAGKAYPLEQEETLVGRDLANDITIPDPEVSRRHARFVMRDESVFIEDLGSTNGTFLNGERISTAQQLRLGDVVTLGENVSMVFEKFVPEEEVTMATPEIEKTPPPVFREHQQVPESYQPPAEPGAFQQPEAVAPHPVPQQPSQLAEEEEEVKRGLPTWLIILIIAIVIIVVVIAITMFFMPASWWCAIDIFDLLQGCPVQ